MLAMLTRRAGGWWMGDPYRCTKKQPWSSPVLPTRNYMDAFQWESVVWIRGIVLKMTIDIVSIDVRPRGIYSFYRYSFPIWYIFYRYSFWSLKIHGKIAVDPRWSPLIRQTRTSRNSWTASLKAAAPARYTQCIWVLDIGHMVPNN